MTRPRALVLEDDPDFAAGLEALVELAGFDARAAATLEDARKRLSETPFDVVLADLELPDGRGLELLDEDIAGSPEVVVVTGHATVDTAVAALRRGALDYLTKPIDGARLEAALANVLRTRHLKAEVTALRGGLRRLGYFGPMVGASQPMNRVYDLISRVAPTQATVLVTGESGTGKEVVASTIHQLSRRSAAPFVALNCGAISPNLIESELFGHEKGSFTGADRRRAGVFEQANGGTLLLDEITEMPLELQVKLLRTLESSAVTRVGASAVLAVDVRVVAATNRDPEAAVKSGRLREDLFYRLNVFPIALPPLRERGDDVVLLAEHFLAELNEGAEQRKRWTPAALERLRQHAWPGNVRELRNVVQRAYILSDGDVTVRALACLSATPARSGGTEGAVSVPLGASLAHVEQQVILRTVEHCGGNKNEAARVLGISLKTLYNRLNVYRAAADAQEARATPESVEDPSAD
ncbi:MAG TPA: sigma-54 dependent transcriptional regulator [Myxococcota bacterium]|jgi:DNA-binding NtrC family response regulator|nr:sigma-54 dependent transcriptional regulator [Myxococcota bacterium]